MIYDQPDDGLEKTETCSCS